MFPSAPLGDREFGHQNGINLHKVPAEGNAASHLLQRTLMLKIGEKIVGDVTGNYKAILAAKEACNDIMIVFLGNDKSIVYAPIGQAFNLTMAHKMNVKRLFDQIAVIITSPAPVATKNTRPVTSAAFWIERNFKQTTRQATMKFEGDVVNAIESLRSRMATFDPLGGSRTDGEDDEKLRRNEDFDSVSQKILADLNRCFSAPAYTIKSAFEKGVVDEAFMTLIDSAMPYALAEVTQRFATSIAEGSTPGDWESNLQLQKTLAVQYAKTSCESTFLLSKAPETFLSTVIDAGLNTVKKIAHTPSNALVFDHSSSFFLELDGTIHLSSQAFRFITTHPVTSKQLRNGTLADRKSIYYKPMEAFTENDPTKSVVMIYQDEAHSQNTEPLEELVKSMREKSIFPNGRVKGQGILSLSNMGKEILAGKKLEESETRRSMSKEYVMAVHEVEEQCLYVSHRGKAYIVDQTREYMPIRDQPDFYGRSPSLVSVKHTLFRVTVGDMDQHHDLYNRWISLAVTSGDKTPATDIEPQKLFSVKPVHMHTPGLSPQHLTFGPNEIKTAFMDPALYDATKQEEAMNYNLTALGKRNEADLHFLKNLFSRKLTAAREARRLFESYYQNRTDSGGVHAKGQTALSSLQMIQLNPFFDVTTQPHREAGKLTFKFVKRDLYMQIPMYEMPPHVVESRGLFLLAKGVREDEIFNMNKKLSEMVGSLTDIEYRMNSDRLPQNLPDVAAGLATMFTKVFGRSSCPLKSINYLFTPFTKAPGGAAGPIVDNWLIIKYVLMPVLTRGQVAFRNGRYTSLRANFLEDDIANVKADATEFDLFEGDHLFLDNYIMSANTHLIVKKKNWPPLLQAAALLMQYCFLTPTALSAIITEECHPGFAVDFLRHEPIYSEQAIFTKVGSHEMILSPGEVTEKENGDGSIELLVQGNIHTTRNTLGAGALIVPSVYPNENGIPRAQNAAGSPIVSRDCLTRTDYGSLSNILEESDITHADKDVIKDQLSIITRHKHLYRQMMGGTESRYPDEFVAIVRPVGQPTEQVQPVMGIAKSSCIPLTGSNNSPWESFYTCGDKSANHYASEMGSIYANRYTKDNMPLSPGSRGFLLRTTNAPQQDIPCSTTAVLEELYNLSINFPVLHPHEKNFVTTSCAPNFDTSSGMTFKTFSGSSDVSGQPLLGKLDVPAAMGYSVPYTQTTDPNLIGATRTHGAPGGLTKILKGPNSYFILSPFTVYERRL